MDSNEVVPAADLDAAVAFAIECGARLAEHQPRERVRVLFDPAGHPFWSHPRVHLTPHIASATQDTREAMAQLVLDNLADFFASGRARTPV